MENKTVFYLAVVFVKMVPGTICVNFLSCG